MNLQAGTRLGPYEIVAHIGSGGMGEVYKGRDTRLNRDVAIKVLPPLFARDPDRMARLEQEARAAAALNAPGIVAVYDIGTQIDRGQPVMYLVMELLEGDSVRALLDAGAITPRKAAEYATQIAAALAVAHARGIVHRDLKPENLFVTRDGRIKILDFGLAKATATAAAAAAGSIATGIGGTTPGMVLGTAAYMAPEQVRGESADARSDIFALGATLYEMLTRRRAFAGDTAIETMNAILNCDSPEIPPELAAVIPGGVQMVLARCLEKRPEDRFHSAHDLALALQAASSGRSTSDVNAAVEKKTAGRLAPAIAIASLLVAALAGAYGLSRPRGGNDVRVVSSLRQLTEMPGAEINPDISPDGRQVLYASSASGISHLYLLRVGGGRALDLTPNAQRGDRQGAFSADGEQIAFRSDRDGGGIFVMGATGESVRRITNGGYDPRWSPDGKRLAYATELVDDPYSRAVVSHVWMVDVASGQTTKLTDGDGVQPVWCPTGVRIAYWANTGGQRDIWTLAPGGAAPVAVTKDTATDWSPEWSPDGRWLYFVSDRGGSPNLWRVSIDQDSGVVAGEPEPVTNGVRPIASARFARNGNRMVIGVFDRSFELSLYNFDPAHADQPSPRSTLRSASLGWCSPSRDAAWLACTSRTGQEDVVLMRADGSETRRLTDDAFKDRIPTWSADDRTLGFMSTRSGRWELWQVGADGSGLRQITERPGNLTWCVWAPDGKHVATAVQSVQPYGIALFDPSQPPSADAVGFIPTDRGAGVDSWSSDGRLLAGSLDDEGGQPLAIMIWDVAAKRLARRIDLPVARTTSQVASFVSGTHRFVTQTHDGVTIVDADTGRSSLILKTAPPLVTRMSGDGRTLLVERPAIEADLWLMEFRK